MTTAAPAPRPIRTHTIVLALGVSLLACTAAMLINATLVAAACVSLTLTLCAALGALRNGQLGPFRSFFAAALATWLLAFTLMHTLPATTETLWLGLPPATAASMFLLWFAPLLLVTLPYSLYFDSAVLSAAELAELQRKEADS